MIIPMKKYSFLIHYKDFQPFLVDLQDLGVLDVVDRKVAPDEETLKLIQRSDQLKKVIRFLQPKAKGDAKAETDLGPDEILEKVLQAQAAFDSARQKIAGLDKSYRTLKPWGNFSMELLRKLAGAGFNIRFYVVSDKKFRESWADEYNLEVISRGEGQVYFVIVQREGEKIQVDAEEVKAPERSAQEVLKEKQDLEVRLAEIGSFYSDNALAFIPVLEMEKAKVDDRISFDTVISNSGKEADNKVMVLEGWVPVQKRTELENFLEKKNIFYLSSNPQTDDKVPVLLKNGKFSRLFEPIGKLYSLPNYQELDLTPLFAPFFMLFFGFCLGDAGYGLLFIILATVFKSRVKQDMKPMLTLLQWLGGITIIFGALTGTFFGINLIELIDNGRLNWMQGVREYMLDSNKLFYFALILGGIQIVYGMIIKAVNITRQRGVRYAFSTIGWISLILGSIVLYALKSQVNEGLIKIVFYILLSISGILILLLNNPEKNIFVNMGGGLWDVYSIATGVLGDLLSYIRLFALGVSSAILGYVFNDLAMQMSGDLPVVSQLIFVIILLIGHGLNIFMASLGAFVHPLRLTFVEFYKNAGFAGGGKAYSPFSKKEVKENLVNNTNNGIE
jgi:V/A-type H+-transporting ATPase subunit I